MSAPSSPRYQDAKPISTRTVAIIKSHALDHRLEIESHILDAGFEIAKERQMEFDPDSDQDFLHELFGLDTPSLFEGPVWVYVLERQNAIEKWNSLIGPADPDEARDLNPNSLRAIYGLSLDQNALIGARDVATAEEQIACLFASSPPFHTSELPASDTDAEAEYALLSGHVQNWSDHALDPELETSAGYGLNLSLSQGYPSPSARSRSVSQPATASEAGSTSRQSSSYKRSDSNSNGKSPFKARPIPSTTAVPSIRPRTTRAASLRAGMPLESNPSQRRLHIPRTREEQVQAFLDVPGHKRSEIIPVASTAPPMIQPRMSRAAALRLAKAAAEATPQPPKQKRANSSKENVTVQKLSPAEVKAMNEKIFEGVPGHKRRESFSVTSAKPPVIAPRPNKSSALRVNKESAPPSSFMFRTPSNTPSRPPSQAGTRSASDSNPNIPQRRSQSQLSVRLDSLPPRPPSITPRLNRSAELRALKGVNLPSPSKQMKSFTNGLSSRAVFA